MWSKVGWWVEVDDVIEELLGGVEDWVVED